MIHKIGYQGIEGSNSFEAARQMSKQLSIEQPQYIPLVTSRGVAEALLEGEIYYGVLAVENIVAGVVEETKKALEGMSYEIVAQMKLPIHHCMFIEKKDISKREIVGVASHVQALLQCRENLNLLVPQVQHIEIEDTAIGARYLAEGILDSHTAVICSKDAGKKYGLYLLAENIEDFKGNYTEFIMIQRKHL